MWSVCEAYLRRIWSVDDYQVIKKGVEKNNSWNRDNIIYWTFNPGEKLK